MTSIKKNFFYLSAYKMLEMLLPMITSPLLSRRLGAEALGTYTYVASIVSFFTTVAELGVYRYGMREIAKVRDNQELLNQTYSDIYITHAFNGGCVAAIYFLYVMFFVNPTYKIYAFILGIAIIGNMLDNAFFYVGIENVKAVSVRDAIVKIAAFVLILILVKNPDDLIKYAILMVTTSLLGKLWGMIHARKYVKIIKPNVANCKVHYKPMAILMIPAIAAIIYQSMDKIMIGAIYNYEDVGYYECASKALIPRNIISALGTVLCPRIANLYSDKKRKEATSLFRNSMVISLIASYVFMFGISAVAREFAPWFWGDDFSVCAELLIGLSVSIPLWCVGEVIRNQFLLPTGRDNEYMLAFVIGVVVNAVANVLLIPNYGAKGAILATLLAELIMSLVQMWLVRKELPCWRMIGSTIPYFIIGVLMLIGVRGISGIIQGNLTVHLCIEVLLGGILFVTLSFLYEYITKKRILMTFIKGDIFIKKLR